MGHRIYGFIEFILIAFLMFLVFLDELFEVAFVSSFFKIHLY